MRVVGDGEQGRQCSLSENDLSLSLDYDMSHFLCELRRLPCASNKVDSAL